MNIKNVSLYNYRNYCSEKFEFDEGLNIIIGNNAQGKTNLLESIYFAAIGKSNRVSKEREVIKSDSENAKILVEVIKDKIKSKIEIYFSRHDKKTIKINSLPIKKIGELMGELNVVYFSPDELKLIKESPEDRRRFMDIDISQTSRQYFYLLGRYDKILANRNKLLKSGQSESSIKDTIDIWNEQLAVAASKIITFRVDFINKLSPYAAMAHSYLTSSKEELNLEYVGITKPTEEEIKDEILKKLKSNFDKDYKLGFTTVGPHRDDIKVTINGIDIKTFGSQGQQRTTALSMKLAELEIIRLRTGQMPVLLLDDVFSELDKDRRKRLINFTSKAQTIITCTDFEFDNYTHKLITIKGGKKV